MPTVFPSSLGGPKPQIELADGTPAVGGRLFFYVAGSVGTKTNTYTDSTGASANTNPVVLDALGMPTTTEIWMESGVSYKVVYAPPGADDPPSSPIFSVDNLNGIGDTAAATFDQWVAGPAPTFISATQFSLVGDQTATFHVGRRVKTLNTSGEIYSTISASVFGAVTTVTLVNDAGVLDAGLTAVSYGLISYVNTSAPVTVTGTITVTRVNTAIIDSNAAVDISLRTNNGTEQVQINHVASANRSLVLSGSNGGNPTIGVTGGSIGLTTDTVVGGIVTANSLRGASSAFMSPITNSLGADVALNNTANYFDGPSVAQGTAGTWFVSGHVQCSDNTVAADFYVKLWDGTTLIASGHILLPSAGNRLGIHLSGVITSPTGNLRISVRDPSSVSGFILYNQSGNAKDCTITAIRIA